MFFIKGKGKKKRKLHYKEEKKKAFDPYTYNVSLMYNMYI